MPTKEQPVTKKNESAKPMPERKVTHNSFTLEKTYDASPARVFKAFSDPVAKAKWFGGPPEWTTEKRSMDFRVGGKEVSSGGPKGGPVSTMNGVYYDIVPEERIVMAYEMDHDGLRISVSLLTVELKPSGAGTRLRLTEQGAFLDGFDNPQGREEGYRGLLEALGRSLKS